MASSINTANIDGNYPVAGQDNSSQGFRDNFTNLKTNLGYAKSEIEDLQSKAVLKGALTGTSLDNDLDGNKIYNVELNRVGYTKNSLGVQSSALALDVTDGTFQTFTTSGSITLSFTGWPATGKYAECYAYVNIADVAHTLTFPAAVSQGLSTVPGMTGQVMTFKAVGYYMFKFSTDDNGSTIRIEYHNAPGVAGALEQRTVAAAIGQAGDSAGMTVVDANYIYVCTGSHDGSTAIWKRAAISTW